MATSIMIMSSVTRACPQIYTNEPIRVEEVGQEQILVLLKREGVRSAAPHMSVLLYLTLNAY